MKYIKTGKEQAMLQDVITQFSNPDRRSVNEGGGCLYNPPNSKPKSIGCAIGMYLSEEVAKKFDDTNHYISSQCIDDVFKNKKLKKLLPEWMQEMNKSFLYNIQNLHDSTSYWNSIKGMTHEGLEAVKNICKVYDLSFKKLKF